MSTDNTPKQIKTYPKYLTQEQKKALRYLAIDVRTYQLNDEQALIYVEKRLGRPVSIENLKSALRDIDKGIVTEEWLRQFSKVGFSLVHQELYQNAMNSYRDTNRKIFDLNIFMNSKKYEDEYKKRKSYYDGYMIRLKQLQIEQGKEVMSYALGTPVIAQIKAMIRMEIIAQQRELTIEKGQENMPELVDETYNIMKNIFETDVKKGRVNISESQINDDIIDNDNVSQYSDKILGDPEKNIKNGIKGTNESNGQNVSTTGTNEQVNNIQSSISSINEETGYSIPTTEQTQRIKENIIKRKREFIF